MKLRIEISEEVTESEVIIRCSSIDENVQRLQSFIASQSSPKLVFYKGQQEYYLPIENILFFETEGELIYAHTANDAFRVKHRLYELESMLPRAFVRSSKGTIVNTSRIHAIDRSLTSSSKIKFAKTHKHVYVSRHYYKALKDKIYERSVLK